MTSVVAEYFYLPYRIFNYRIKTNLAIQTSESRRMRHKGAVKGNDRADNVI